MFGKKCVTYYVLFSSLSSFSLFETQKGGKSLALQKVDITRKSEYNKKLDNHVYVD